MGRSRKGVFLSPLKEAGHVVLIYMKGCGLSYLFTKFLTVIFPTKFSVVFSSIN